MTTDRTVKILLVVIALLLVVIAARPLFTFAPQAFAASDNRGIAISNNDTTQFAGHRLQQVGMMTIPRSATVREVQVIDSAQAFVVRFDNQIAVFRVDKINIGPRNTTSTSTSTN